MNQKNNFCEFGLKKYENREEFFNIRKQIILITIMSACMTSLFHSIAYTDKSTLVGLAFVFILKFRYLFVICNGLSLLIVIIFFKDTFVKNLEVNYKKLIIEVRTFSIASIIICSITFVYSLKLCGIL